MSKLSKSLFLLAFMWQPLSAADGLPETEIYLLDLSNESTKPENISQHQGYDNQPAFSKDGSQIYYSRFDDEQTDIWSYDLSEKTNNRLSHTPESEYSPRPSPHPNSISVVRVEMDNSQRFSVMDMESKLFKNLASELSTVGYYSWFSSGSVALFLLPEPFQLILYASMDEQIEVASNIGRAIARDPLSGDLLYVDKSTAPWQITAFNVNSSEKQVIAKLFPKHEDFAISSSGTLWTSLGGKLYSRASGEKHWKLRFDLRAYDLNNITRLAISPDESKLAVVNTTTAIKQD